MHSNNLNATLQRLVKIDQGFLILDVGRFPDDLDLTTALSAQATTLLATPKLAQFVAGIALPAFWWHQTNFTTNAFLGLVNESKTLAGIDLGVCELSSDDESLKRKLTGYYAAGVRFVLKQVPLTTARPGVLALARFARICQQVGLVPIIGARVELANVRSTLPAQEIAAQTFLNVLANALFEAQVVLENCLLQWQFIKSDLSTNDASVVKESVIANIRCLRRGVLSAIPEIVVEISPADAMPKLILNDLKKPGRHPWYFGFALRWELKNELIDDTETGRQRMQKELYRCLRVCSAAQTGKYSSELEAAPVSLRPNPTPL